MLPTDQWEMLVAPWSHLTLTSKRSGINLIRTKNHQLNKCLKRPEKDRESSDKIEDAFFDCYSLDGARYPESMIFFPQENSQAYLQRNNHEAGKMNTRETETLDLKYKTVTVCLFTTQQLTKK